MIKSELVQIVAARNPHLYHRDVENIVNAVLDEITDALAAGNRVELRGFGAFSVKNRPSRSGRNPRTGESVFVEELAIAAHGLPRRHLLAFGDGAHHLRPLLGVVVADQGERCDLPRSVALDAVIGEDGSDIAGVGRLGGGGRRGNVVMADRFVAHREADASDTQAEATAGEQ